MITKKLFLASSSELKVDREQFEIFINRKNKGWVPRGVFLEMVIWEDFLDAVSKTRLQDEYNKAIHECDLFVMLFWTKVGPYTAEEFETAFGRFKAINKPFIFTYFKDAEISVAAAEKKDLMSLWAFQEKLKDLGHFQTVYKNVDQLKFEFDQQLDKLAASKGFAAFQRKEEHSAALSSAQMKTTVTWGIAGVAGAQTVNADRGESGQASLAFDPYPGLRPLRTEHAECIFGRDKDISAIVKARDSGKRFLMVWGASGVGKSSLVQAGIIGRDRTARNLTVIPARKPARQLADALQQFIPSTTGLAILHSPDQELVQLNDALLSCPRLYVFVDQLERLYQTSEREIADFARILVALVRVPRCTVILTHRSDQMAEWARHPLLSAPGEFEWWLHPMTDVRASYLRDIIQGPARRAGKGLPEPELIEQLIEDFDEQRNATPLLALTLHDLYGASGHGARPMAFSDYRAKGGLKGMLEERTRQLSHRLARYGFGDDQLQALFLLIVDFDHEGRAVAKAATREDVVALFATGTLDDPWDFVEQELVGQFFLRTEQTESPGAGALTLAHEVFFEEWPLLRKWIEDNKHQIQQIRELEREAQRWKINGSSPAYLLPRERLDTATVWVSGQPARFSENVRQLTSEFVARSVKHAKEQRIEEAIFRGEIPEVDDLLKEGVKATVPLAADAFAPFYDVIWGELETEYTLTTTSGGLEKEDGPLNRKNAMFVVANGFTPIHFAALAGRADKIRLLVTLGVDVDLQTAKGTTPLACAAFAGQFEAVKVLLSMGAKPWIQHQEHKLGAVDWATQRGHVEVAELLLNQLGDFSQSMPAEVARGLFLSASYADDAGQLRRFLPRLADGPTRVSILQEVLTVAAQHSTECALLLIEAGANPVQSDAKGFVPFHVAAAVGAPATLKVMIEAVGPADLDARDGGGSTVLGAVLTGGLGMDEKAALLLAAGCDPNLTQSRSVTPLMLAAGRGFANIVERLLARGDAQLDARDEDGDTALMFAATSGHNSIVRLLLDNGADLSAATKKGRTALIQAVLGGHEGVVQLLLDEARVLPAAKDEQGLTALMLAARAGHYPVVTMLLGRTDEQQVNAVDRFGRTALEHAALADQDRAASLLLDSGARLPLWARLTTSSRMGDHHVVE